MIVARVGDREFPNTFFLLEVRRAGEWTSNQTSELWIIAWVVFLLILSSRTSPEIFFKKRGRELVNQPIKLIKICKEEME